MNALRIYDRYVKTKIRTCGDTNFCGVNVPEDGVESESFTIILIGSLLVYESKYYLQVHSDNCTYKILDNKMIDYLDVSLLETDEDHFKFWWKCFINVVLR